MLRLDGFISRWLIHGSKVCLKTVIFMRCARSFVCINYHCSSKAVLRDLCDACIVSVRLIWYLFKKNITDVISFVDSFIRQFVVCKLLSTCMICFLGKNKHIHVKYFIENVCKNCHRVTLSILFIFRFSILILIVSLLRIMKCYYKVYY